MRARRDSHCRPALGTPGRRTHLRRAAAALLLTFIPALAHAAPLSIVAAENMYADIARQISGPGTMVSAIISNPDQDPHDFEPVPSTARLVAGASVVIFNGAGYDAWMRRLIAASPNSGRHVIEVARLLNAGPGTNPHFWYDPRMAPALAGALHQALPASAAGDSRLEAFLASLSPITARIAALRARYAGTPVAATEPVYDDMASAIGLVLLERRFALAVMNGTEPAASDVAAFERDLRSRRIKALIYNRQATDASARRLLAIAEKSGVPAVPVTETMPAWTDYQHWIMSGLDALEAALGQ